jgi:hypothetical protein
MGGSPLSHALADVVIRLIREHYRQRPSLPDLTLPKAICQGKFGGIDRA